MEEVFAAQSEQISLEESEALEQDILLEELHEAAKLLAKNKVPGRDGVPVEFFLTLWDQIGPVLLKLLQDGLKSGILHPQLTHGIIVLLAKDGDQLLMGNKRGLTFLNCALKVLAKLYQIRLSSILQGFISEQQTAFLPGRSIHKAVMLANEILHMARNAEESFLLLKLDTIKAFDCLGWSFLARLLARIGCGPKFISMVHAMYASATASVLI